MCLLGSPGGQTLDEVHIFNRMATVNDLRMFVRIMKGDLKIQVTNIFLARFQAQKSLFMQL